MTQREAVTANAPTQEGMPAMKPQRIRRQRVKGWHMPKNTIVVSRPSKWGNPYSPTNYFIVDTGPAYPNWPSRPATLAECVDAYRRDLTCTEDHRCYPDEHAWTRDLDLNELRGKNLACWCPLLDAHGNRVPCHADVLLELANKAVD